MATQDRDINDLLFLFERALYSRDVKFIRHVSILLDDAGYTEADDLVVRLERLSLPENKMALFLRNTWYRTT